VPRGLLVLLSAGALAGLPLPATAAPPAHAATAAGATTSAHPTFPRLTGREDARANLVACRTALSQPGRTAVFEGRMRSASGSARRLAMRFDLLRRDPGERRFRRVAAPGLGVWHRSDRGVTTYVFRKKVRNLAAPGAYRALVSFRWEGAGGRALARARRLTRVCRQPDPRPNLQALGVEMTGADDGMATYVARMSNAGRSAAEAFDVTLRVNGGPRAERTVSVLPARTEREVTFTAPACAPGSLLELALDPDDRVAETSEGDNARAVPCPGGPAAGAPRGGW
jgi:hypothetical protein